MIKTLLLSMRPPFLLLTIFCVLLAYSLALASGSTISLPVGVATFVSALFAHIAVNTLNEYQDFSSGLDLHTEKTAFSGGSGALPQQPAAARAVLLFAQLSIAITCLAGTYLLYVRGLTLLWPGLLGILLIVGYTSHINRWPWLCLIAPGTGFGLLMVAGSFLALTGQFELPVLLIALVPFLLVNNLLLLNQLPDIEADRQVGRNHFPIRYGVLHSLQIYLLNLLLCGGLLIGLLVQGQLPISSWMALLPLLFGIAAWRGARRYGRAISLHPQYLAANVAAALLTPLLLAVSLLIGVNGK